jgi:glycosyltransferase involved in cell wall biosynthesis
MTHPITREIVKTIKEGGTVVPSGATIEKIFPKNRVAAAMIMGDEYDRATVQKCVSSLKASGVHKLFLAYNGKSRRTITWLFDHLARIEFPFLVQKFRWEDDFAKARQQSFDLIPKDEFDWIIWIDSDDVLIPEKSFDEMFESIDEYTQGIYLRYDYSVDPETGAVDVQQWRERVLSTKVDWQWKYPIHEVATSPIGTQFAKCDHLYLRHLRDLEDSQKTRERNRRIISKSLSEDPTDPRMQFYFATEVMAEAEALPLTQEKVRIAKAGIVAYRRFMSNELNQSQDDLYLAANRIGELYMMVGDYNRAIDAYLNSLKINPDWPDAYIGLARACMHTEDWARTKSFASLALQRGIPKTPSGITPSTYTFTPNLLRGIANEEMGLFADALVDYEEAEHSHNNEFLQKRIESAKQKLAATAKDKGERNRRRGTRPDKSIAFVAAPIPDPWHPELEKTRGAGGAETCIMRLAPRFAADGWRTVVFGTPSPEHRGIYDEVEWWDANEFLTNEKFTVIVGSRIPELFGADLNANKKILWMHDVNVGGRMIQHINSPDAIFGLTDWHCQHLHRLYGINKKKLHTVYNGIELNLYDDWDKSEDVDDELRFIWSSSPDRGLGTLISMWPVIKSWYPSSRLDIFYGWTIIDKIISGGANNSGPLGHLKQTLLANIDKIGGEEGGIYQHGRIPQSELAKWQLQAHIWPYPTEFMETFCITAIESQAAGIIPVASKLAALNETVACPDLLVEGWPSNKDYQTRWLKTLENVVESSLERQKELQVIGRKHAEIFTWDNAYIKWNDILRQMG